MEPHSYLWPSTHVCVCPILHVWLWFPLIISVLILASVLDLIKISVGTSVVVTGMLSFDFMSFKDVCSSIIIMCETLCGSFSDSFYLCQSGIILIH